MQGAYNRVRTNLGSECALRHEMLQLCANVQKGRNLRRCCEVVTFGPGHMLGSDFDCYRFCGEHMIDCARYPSSGDALRHEILISHTNDKKVESLR